jgi:5-methylcytosine-specific restriction endonuclease McrA
VIRLFRYVQAVGRVRFSRINLLARDAFRCQYCSKAPVRAQGQPDLEQLELEHVIPRSRAVNGRVWLPWSRVWTLPTCWENVVASCHDCNHRKADRTPREAGLVLRKVPRVPTPIDVLRISLTRIHIPTEWKAFLPTGSEWRDYWEVELEP